MPSLPSRSRWQWSRWACPSSSPPNSTTRRSTARWSGASWVRHRGGRSTAVAGSASRPNEYYFGAAGGGLWKTTDGGQTWRPVTDGQLTSSSVAAVGVCPANPDVVYIGTGETELRGNIMQGDGVYKSTDAGKTWTHIGLEPTQSIAKIVGPPRQLRRGVGGRPRRAIRAERGAWRLQDDGRRLHLAQGPLQDLTWRAPSTWRWTPTTPTSSTPPSGKRGARAGGCPRAVQTRGCGSPRTAGNTGKISPRRSASSPPRP